MAVLLQSRLFVVKQTGKTGIGTGIFRSGNRMAGNQMYMGREAGSDLLVESTIHPEPRTGIRAIGIAIGVLVSLGILAASIGLLAADSAEDHRILQSIGAGPGRHRRLSAASAAILAAG